MKNQIAQKKITIGMVLCAFIFITAGATLHHGWANYNQDIELEYTGVILDNDIGNPHTYIDFEVTEAESEAAKESGIEEWLAVLAPLGRMERRGLSDHSMLAIGDTVSILGYPHKETEDEMRVEYIVIGDTKIQLR